MGADAVAATSTPLHRLRLHPAMSLPERPLITLEAAASLLPAACCLDWRRSYRRNFKDIIPCTPRRIARANNIKASINVGNMLAAGFKPLQAAIRPMAMDSSE